MADMQIINGYIIIIIVKIHKNIQSKYLKQYDTIDNSQWWKLCAHGIFDLLEMCDFSLWAV